MPMFHNKMVNLNLANNTGASLDVKVGETPMTIENGKTVKISAEIAKTLFGLAGSMKEESTATKFLSTGARKGMLTALKGGMALAADHAILGDDGCAPDALKYWFSDKVLNPPKPTTTTPRKPPKPITLADLPPACKGVLEAPAKQAKN